VRTIRTKTGEERIWDIRSSPVGGLPLSVCGELAGRKRATPHLVCLGFGALSVPPSVIPEVKAEIRHIRLGPHPHPQAVPVERVVEDPPRVGRASEKAGE